MVYQCFESNFKWKPNLVDDTLSRLFTKSPTSMYRLFSSLLAGIFSVAHPDPPYTHLHCPRTHGHTSGGHCGCSKALSPDTLLWPRHLPGGGSLRCSCTQPWSPLCTLCQTPFHSWGPQEAHRKELAKRKKYYGHVWFKMVF